MTQIESHIEPMIGIDDESVDVSAGPADRVAADATGGASVIPVISVIAAELPAPAVYVATPRPTQTKANNSASVAPKVRRDRRAMRRTTMDGTFSKVAERPEVSAT